MRNTPGIFFSFIVGPAKAVVEQELEQKILRAKACEPEFIRSIMAWNQGRVHPEGVVTIWVSAYKDSRKGG